MVGKSPVKKIGDRIIIQSPNGFQEMTTVCVVVDVILVLFSILLNSIKDLVPQVTGMIIFLWVIVLVLNFIVYGFRGQFVFNSRTKVVSKEGISCFIPYQKKICNFDEITILGIRCYESKNKGKYFYSYELVFATKQQLSKFEILARTYGVNHTFCLNELNKIGKILAETIKCRFIEGEPKRSIEASQVFDEVSYTVGDSIKRI